MTQVITFERYRPTPRYDDLPWTNARIEETADPDAGPWVEVETIALSPVDTDPSRPATRNLTTELASSTAGLWYRVIFIDADDDESLPTDPVQNTPPANLYVTRNELKEILALQNESFADQAIDVAVEAASRACDAYKRKGGTGFYATEDITRTYSPGRGDTVVRIDDLVAADEVTVDLAGDGTYETEWTEGTDFVFGPENADADGRPWNQLILLPQSTARFPGYLRALKITGTFGWESTPMLVKQAAIALANDLLHRTREAPLDVLVATAADTVATARLGRLNRTASNLLDLVDPPQGIGTLQLG